MWLRRRPPQLDAVSLPVHAPAERPVLRTVDLLVDRDAAGAQLRQQAVEIGDAEIEHLRLGGVAEVRRVGRERGPDLMTGLALGELEDRAEGAAKVVHVEAEMLAIPGRERGGIARPDEDAAEPENPVPACFAHRRSGVD